MASQPEPALHKLETEGVNPASANIDSMSGAEIAAVMNGEDASVAAAVATQLPQIGQAIDAIADRLGRGGRLIYIGAGTSGRLGVLDASECPPTFSVPPSLVVGLIAGGPGALISSVEGAEDNPDLGRTDLQQIDLSPDDALVGITASGRTPYVIGALEYGREIGALTVAVACTSDPLISRPVDIIIAVVTGPEVVSGSTRLKAGTAQKMVLNMLSTGAMILIGKTYGNLMVDMQTSNDKLRRRAVRIVGLATGLSEQEAAALLSASSGETKTAIVAALADLPPVEARERLQAAGGVVRKVLAR